MSKSHSSLARRAFSKVRSIWGRRRNLARSTRRRAGFEWLEPRQMLNADPAYNPNSNFHIHFDLNVILNGEQVVIPKGVGDNLGADSGKLHTHDFSGLIHVHSGPRETFVTLDEFFEVWQNDTVLGNASAVFTSTSIFGLSNNATHTVRMYVNGEVSTDFGEHKIHDGDNIVVSYEPIEALNAPSFHTIGNQTVLGGAPLWLGLNGFDPNGDALTFSVTVGNPSLLEAVIPQGNRSIIIDVEGFGPMTFELFDHLVSRPTDRIVELAEAGFYDRTATNEIIFHRVVPNFVIQAGDPTGTGSGGSTLGHFDDQFHVDLQHTSPGLLSMAKSGDDTNDSQFFITHASPRHLDFNHSIFGKLVEGEAVRQAIQSVPVTNDRPNTPVVINSITVVENDVHNALLMLKAAEGASGSTSVTVTVSDPAGNTYSETFQVTVTPDTFNGGPFLADIPPVQGLVNQPIQIQLVGIDVEGDAVFYDAIKPASETVNYTLNVNNQTGLVTITPPTDFVGTFNVLVGVSPATTSNTADAFDTQLVPVTVVGDAPAAPTAVDLLPASDTGISNSDNITNADTLQFQVQGVTAGAVVKLKLGQTVIAEGTASGSTITLSTTGVATAGEGTHSIVATQTVGGAESDPSPPLNVTYDITPPPAFTSTAPSEARVGLALVYDAQNPEEGTTGFRYELVTPPAGATINASTGLLIWTPTADQVGTQTFGISAIDAAGNVRTQTLNVLVDQEVAAEVELNLFVIDANEDLLTTVSPGQEFFLVVLTRDVRTPPAGVFSAFLDIFWDSTLAEVAGPIQYGTTYGAGQIGSTSTPGLINDAGAVASSITPIGGGNKELFRVPMRATAAGTLVFAANPTGNVGLGLDILVYESDEPVALEAVRFQTATVTVEASFTAVDDLFNVDEDSQNVTLDPLANDTDIGGAENELTIVAVGQTSHGGTVTIAQDGKTLVYSPFPDFFGTETFTYTVQNQHGETATATITVEVQPVNDPPTAVDDVFSVAAGSSNNVLDVLANDLIEPDVGETLRVIAVSAGSAGGTITIGNNGANVRYTPLAGFTGTETFTYTISDRVTGGLTDTATVTVTVGGVVAQADAFTVEANTSNHIFNVLSNDQLDPQVGGTLTITAVGTPNRGGSVEIVEDGTRVRYTPAADFQGLETFTYTISDGEGGTATTTVSVTVTGAVPPPAATNDSFTGFRNTTSTLDVLANDTAPAGTIINAVTQGSQGGTVTIVNGGTRISYTPANDFTGTETFTYTIRDTAGRVSNAATVTITVQEFSPSSLSGFVYFDVNNDGIKSDAELPIAGVTITLTGTATGGAPVNLTTKTAADGSYRFENLAPGNYTITQTQPAFTINGRTTAGSQGGTAGNNTITIANLAQGTTGTGNNFGELGRQPQTLSLRDLFASNAGDHALVALNSTGDELWHTLSGPDWQGTSNGSFSLNGTQLQLAVTNSQSQQVVANLDINNGSEVFVLAQTTAARLLRVRGGPSKLTFTPLPTNQPPTANPNSYTTAEDTVLTVTAAQGVLSNDTDPENNPLTAILVTQPQHGSIAFSADGSFTYTPNANFHGTDTFTYRASDGTSQSAPATVTITVTPVNDAPVAVNDSYTTPVDTALTVAAAQGVLANDTDVDGDTLTAILVTQPTNGTLTLSSDGSFTYTPNAGFVGTDTFTYRASDGSLDSNLATVTITVTGENTAPVANDDSYEIDEDGTLIVTEEAGVLANDTDADGDNLTAEIVTQPTNGTVALSPDGSFTYSPNANFHGTDTFTYRAFDGTALSNIATVTITVHPVNDAPVANDDEYSTQPNTPLVVDAANGVLANDIDVDGDELTATVLVGPANGTLVLNADGSFTYTPNEDFVGTDTFTYRASDSELFDDATVTIVVSLPPVAQDDAYETDEDTPLVVDAENGVLANDSDPENDPLTAVLVAGPQNGTLTLNTDGSFTYVPNQDFHGEDSFTYRAAHGASVSEIATVVITIHPVNDAPVAVDDAYTTLVDTPLVVDAASGVLANDSDVDGDELAVSQVVTDVANGTLVLSADGSFTYTPNAGFVGTDTFVYEVTDGELTAQATVTITVGTSAENTPPVALDDEYEIDEDGTLIVTPQAGVLANDTDEDGDNLTAILVEGPEHGTLTLNSDGSFTYVPNADFHGEDSFTYQAFDGTQTSNVATVTITVHPVNDAPVAQDDVYATLPDTPLVVEAPGVLANDSDVDGDELTVVEVLTDVTNGTLVLNADGSFTYTPDEGFVGIDTFVYQITDGELFGGATVTIFVAQPPEAVDDAYEIDEDTPLVVDFESGLLSNDTDPQGHELTVELVAGPDHGSLTLNLDGSFTYTPDENFHGTDSFTYRAVHGPLASDVATVEITVHPVNDAPVAHDDFYLINADTTLVIDAAGGVLANDEDVDGDELTVSLITDVEHGTLVLNPDGSFTYEPDAGFFGTDTFVYAVTDGFLSDQATVTIRVNAVPVAADDAYETDEDVPLVVLVGDGVLTNDTDDDAGDILTVVIVDPPQHGALEMNPDGSFTYTPDEDFHGEDSFTYRATDGIAESNLATVTITVNPVNDAPVAGDDFYETDQDTELVVDAASGVLANDFDPDGDELSVVVVTGPLNGILVLETDGSFTYTPNEGFFGSDSFSYQVTDGFLSAQATVTITVHEIGEGEAPSDAALLAVLSEDDDGVSSSSDDDWTTATDAVLTDLAS